MEAGPVSVVGMGPSVLTWADLGAWERATGIELQPWESRLVRSLSGAYLSESRRAEERNARAPWLEPINAAQQALLEDREAMRKLAEKAGAGAPLKRAPR